MKKYMTRLGDGSIEYMTEDEIMNDIKIATEDAAKKGRVDPLTKDDMEHILDIITMPGTTVGVDPGAQIVTTTDIGSYKMLYSCGVPMDRCDEVLVRERGFCGDSSDFGYEDYSFKPTKASVDTYEAKQMQNALDRATMPLLYGAMPNLGLYTKPDGPCENWAELLPLGKIEEARQAQEEAVKYSVDDIVYVAGKMYEMGADGINLDTTGAAGDADFLAGLKAVEIIKEKYPTLGVEMGMAGEFVLGMHGKLTYDGVRLAGLYPHKQVKLAEKAGVDIFGAVVNTNCSKSFAWNISRVCTLLKPCVAVAEIPIHANAGMGVNAMPMSLTMPLDSVSRADKAMVEICKIDGL